MPTRNLRDGTLVVRDGTTPTPLSLTVALDEGDLSFSETQNVIEVLDRGVLDHIRKGDEAPVDVSFSIKFVEFRGDHVTPSLYEVLKKLAPANAWVSTLGVLSDVHTLLLEFTLANIDTGGSDEMVALNHFYHTSIEFSEGDEYNTISVTGKAFVTSPTISETN